VVSEQGQGSAVSNTRSELEAYLEDGEDYESLRGLALYNALERAWQDVELEGYPITEDDAFWVIEIVVESLNEHFMARVKGKGRTMGHGWQDDAGKHHDFKLLHFTDGSLNVCTRCKTPIGALDSYQVGLAHLSDRPDYARICADCAALLVLFLCGK
jgi:hypothetical protein